MNIQLTSLWQAIRAAVFAVLIGVALAFLFAVIRYFLPMPRGITLAVVQVLKAIALLVGCFLFLKGEGGWWKGLFAGAVFCALSFLVFAFAGGVSWWAILDLLISLVTGALGGIAAVNLKRP